MVWADVLVTKKHQRGNPCVGQVYNRQHSPAVGKHCQGTCNTDETQTKHKRTSNDTNLRMKEGKEEEKSKKIFFKDSSIFDIVKFKEEFKDWSNEKVNYYHNALNTWSNENNKKIDWVATARTWARKDEQEGKIKFDVKKPTITINNQFALMR